MEYTRANNITIPYPHTTINIETGNQDIAQGINELILQKEHQENGKSSSTTQSPTSQASHT